MRPLPHGWSTTTVDNLAELVEYGTSAKANEDPTGIPVLRMGNLVDGSIVADSLKYLPVDHDEFPKLLLKPGDVLFNRTNSPELVGKSAVFKGRPSTSSFASYLIRLRLGTACLPEYVTHFINSTFGRHWVNSVVTQQVGQANVNGSKLRALEVPMAPIAEQRRIVAAIEQHLSDIDAGVAGLKRTLAHLKRYRAAVLKAACEGRLVPTEAALAKKEKRDYEPADVLLKRILRERRARWETDQLAKMAAKGQTPKDDEWKAKYEEPAPPDIEGLAALPDGWGWIGLGSVIGGIEAGASFKCEERTPSGSEIGVVKVSAVTWGEYDEDETKTCMDPSRVDPGLFVAPRDFLFSRANTIELVGACVIAKRVTRSVMLSDKILRFRLVILEPLWVMYMLRSRLGRNEIERLATGNQESMRNIGQERIRQIRIPLPPLAEQHRIVAEVDRLLSTADETEQTVRAQLARAARLRQSVLKRAFEGKLVPQDPTDEPAAVLLERIRAQKAAEPKAAARGRRS